MLTLKIPIYYLYIPRKNRLLGLHDILSFFFFTLDQSMTDRRIRNDPIHNIYSLAKQITAYITLAREKKKNLAHSCASGLALFVTNRHCKFSEERKRGEREIHTEFQ